MPVKNDILEKLQAENKTLKKDLSRLKKLENDYREFFDVAPIACLELDSSGRFLNVNEKWCSLLGFSKEEVLGRQMTEFVNQKDSKSFQRNFTQFIKTGAIKNKDYELVHQTGRHIPVQVDGIVITDSKGRFKKAHFVIKDITERKQVEDHLKQERDFTAKITEISPVGMTVVTLSGEIVFANSRAEEILGLSKASISNRTYNDPRWKITDFEGNPFPVECLPFIVVKQTRKSVSNIRHAIEWPDGKRIFLSINASPMFDDQNEFSGIVATIEDISEQIQLESTHQVLIEQSKQGFAILQDNRVVFANHALEEMFGYSVEEVLSFSFEDTIRVIHPDDRDRVTHVLSSRITGKKIEPRQEFRVIKKDGSVGWIESFGSVIHYKGHPAVQVSFTDVTERKIAEENLKEAKEFSETIIDLANVIILTLDVHGNIQTFNRFAERLTGYTRQEVVGKNWFTTFIPENNRQEIPIVFKKVLQGLQELPTYENAILCKNKEERLIRWQNTVLENVEGKQVGILSIGQDITEQRRAALYLKESEERFRQIAENIQDVVYIYDPIENHFLYVSPAYEKIWGRKRDLVYKDPQEFFYAIYHEDQPDFRKAVELESTQKKYLDLKYRIVAPGGQIRWIWTKNFPVQDDTGKVYRIAGIIRDITVEKRMEQELATSADIVESIPSGLFIYQYVPPDQLILLKANPAAENLIPLDTHQWIGREFNEIWPAAKAEGISEQLLSVVESGKIYETESQEYKDKQLAGAFRIRAFRLSGQKLAVAFENITKRRIAEESLKEREATLSSIFHAAPMGIGMVINRIFVFVNEHLCDLIGYMENELLGKSTKLLHSSEEEYLKVNRTLNEQINGEGFAIVETVLVHKDKTLINILLSSTLIDSENPSRGMIFTALDITERKKVEESLKDREAMLTSIFNAAPIGIGMVLNRNIIFVNERLCDMVGFSKDEILGHSTSKFYPTEEEFLRIGRELYSQVKDTGIATIESTLRRKTGEVINVILGVALLDPNHPSGELTFTAMDITERKKAEAQIERDLHEKEVLLREVHHRVKNNLQVICSLLNLQSAHVQDETSLQMFKESENRVRSIAMVHEELYRSEDFSSIPVRDYLTNLIRHLFQIYQVKNLDIKLDVEVDDLQMDIDTAIPTGLLINELISNILKHAFPAGWKGKPRIRVKIHKMDEERVKLTISDNGIGLPENVESDETGTLGFRLITVLSEGQLGGKLNIIRRNGTVFELIYKLKR